MPLAPVFLRKDRVSGWLAGPALAYLGLVLAYSSRTNLRYLIPGIVALTIVSAAATVRATRRWLPRGLSRRLVLGLLVAPLAVAPLVWSAARWATTSAALGHLVGLRSARDFALTRPFESTLPRVASEVRELLPDDARLLLLFEPRGHAFGHTARQDSQMNHWPLLALAPIDVGCLEASGSTHVLLNTNTLAYRFERGIDPAVFEWAAFADFSERCLQEIYSSEGFRLFEIRARPDA